LFYHQEGRERQSALPTDHLGHRIDDAYIKAKISPANIPSSHQPWIQHGNIND